MTPQSLYIFCLVFLNYFGVDGYNRLNGFRLQLEDTTSHNVLDSGASEGEDLDESTRKLLEMQRLYNESASKLQQNHHHQKQATVVLTN
jgi:hypothetical protein